MWLMLLRQTATKHKFLVVFLGFLSFLTENWAIFDELGWFFCAVGGLQG